MAATRVVTVPVVVLVSVAWVLTAHAAVSAVMVRLGAGRFRRWTQGGASHDGRVKGSILAWPSPASVLDLPTMGNSTLGSKPLLGGKDGVQA
jgi:hypothetical protein